MKINNKFNSNKFSIISPLMLSLLLIMSVVLSIGIVEAAPERIVSLAPSNTEILFAIGAGDRVVGVTIHCNYPPEAIGITKVGGFWPPNPELIVNVSPTIIFAKPHHRRLIEGINKTHITVFIEEKNVEDIYRNIEYIGTRTGNSDKARELVGRMRSRVQKIEDIPTARKPSVLYATWHDPIFAAGSDTFIGDVIGISGGINVVKEKGWPIVGVEPLIGMNPRIIITSNEMVKNGILAIPALSGIDAVRNRRVIVIRCEDVISRPGPRIVRGIEDMHAIIIQNLIPEIPIPDPGVTPPPIRKELIVITPVAPAIIGIEDSVEIKIMKAGVPVSIDLRKTNMEITIITLKDVANIPLRVQQLTERPAGIPEIPDKVYKYFSITTGIESKYIDNATIKFNVSKSWINKTNISTDSIRLNRFNKTNERWDVLPTKLIRKDINYIIFSALAPHFSIFSVTGKEVVVPPVAPPVPALTSISVPAAPAPIVVGGTHTFRALPVPANATIGTVTWVVANTTVGTITPAGVFTARAAGATSITATFGGITGTTTATVTAPPLPALTGISVPAAPAPIVVGGTHTFTASPVPAGARIGTVTWRVANTTVGTITPAGVFTARAVGATDITTTYGGITGTVRVTVTAPPKRDVPGFGIITTILGILGVALILLKKKN